MDVTSRGKFAVLLCLVIFIGLANTTNNGREVNAILQRNHLQSTLRGKELQVVTGNFPPYISILRNSSGHITEYSDYLYQQLLYLSQKLKFTYKIFPAPENTFGVEYNKNWNGVIGTVTKLEADIGLVPVTVTLEQHEAIEFSGFVGGDNTGILVKYPAANISFTSTFDVFSIGIWIAFVISGIAIAAMSVIFSYITKRCWAVNEKPEMRTGIVMWYLYGTMVSQGTYFPCQQPSQKLLAATWCLVAFVFVNIYNSTLTSYMSVTYQRPEINSFRDLALATKYKATVLIGSIQDTDLRMITKQSQKGYLKIISDRIQKCSLECRKFSFEEMAISVLEDENCVSIIPWSAGIASLQQYNTKRCRLAMAFESTSWKPMFLAVPKSSPYIEQINRESLWFFDTGLREYWFDAYEKPPEKCRLDFNSKGVATKTYGNQIKLEQFHLLFLILFGGYLLAFMQFFREKFICPLRRSSSCTSHTSFRIVPIIYLVSSYTIYIIIQAE